MPKPEVTGLEPAQVLRGMLVKVSGTGFDQAKEIRVRLNQREIKLDKPRGDDAKSFTFRVPADLPLGRYTVRAVFLRQGQEPNWVEGVPIPSQNDRLRVISDTSEKLSVTAIHPLVGYPESNRFGFTVLGEGFSTVPTDNELICTGRGAIEVNWVDVLPSKDPPVDKVYGRVVSTRQLDFLGIPQAQYEGPLKFQIRVGDSISAPPAAVTFARVRKGTPWVGALGVVALLTGLVYIPVTWKLGHPTIAARRYPAWAMFLIDQETDTLSLSKFQLYVWTAVAVFGYTYLTVARSLIQGVFEFAPIPEGLPAILGISGGTAVLAAGVTKSHGSKGAGQEQPSFSDLITNGGVVVAERFQFLVWTVLGALAFLFLVVSSDPATIQDLPKVPEGFLYLMGVSSAGYLGGKLGRMPGPIIDTIVAQEGTVVIDIQGRNLSQQASFMIDDHEVTYDLLTLPSDVSASGPASSDAPAPGPASPNAPAPGPASSNAPAPAAPPYDASRLGPKKDATLRVIRRDTDAVQTGMAQVLRLSLTDEKTWLAGWGDTTSDHESSEPWLRGTHRLCLVNSDGQKAIWPFTIKPK